MKTPVAPQTQDDGRREFLWRHGVLQVGLPAAIITALLLQAAEDGVSWSSYWSVDFFVRLMIALVFLAPVAGYIWGAIMWRDIQKRKTRTYKGSD